MGVSLLSVCVFATLIAFTHGWSFTIVAGAMVPVLIITSFYKESAKATQVLAEHRAFIRAKTFAEEVFTNIRTVMVFSGQKKEIATFKQELATGFNNVRNKLYITSFTEGAMWLFIFLFYAFIYWYGTVKVLADRRCTDSMHYEVYDAGSMFTVCQFVLRHIVFSSIS